MVSIGTDLKYTVSTIYVGYQSSLKTISCASSLEISSMLLEPGGMLGKTSGFPYRAFIQIAAISVNLGDFAMISRSRHFIPRIPTLREGH